MDRSLAQVLAALNNVQYHLQVHALYAETIDPGSQRVLTPKETAQRKKRWSDKERVLERRAHERVSTVLSVFSAFDAVYRARHGTSPRDCVSLEQQEFYDSALSLSKKWGVTTP